MNSLNEALLVNLIGFAAGIALYSLLAGMVVRYRSADGRIDLRLFATAWLGLIWNAGELIILIRKDLTLSPEIPLLSAAAYSALGFLPAVVIHSSETEATKKYYISQTAYCLSTFAATLHFYDALTGIETPSVTGLITMTIGSAVLAVALIVLNFRQPLEKKAVLAAAIFVFALSGLHLTGDRESTSWLIELTAHQASLAIAIAILLQNFRFAFADLFLKRAISLLILAAVALGLYVLVAAPLLRYHETHDRDDVLAISLIILLWVTTALVYGSIHRLAVFVVDKLILRRPDYRSVELNFAAEIEAVDTVNGVLNALADRLAAVLTARRSVWHIGVRTPPPDTYSAPIKTHEEPSFTIELGDLAGGRRLLSEELEMLDQVLLAAARRIDAIRIIEERLDREVREQEFAKLAAQAQVTALRSQMNPHFLFNTLNTIGALIQSSPQKALETLMQLTKLLRGSLSSTGEFTTVEEEMNLVESYLNIERARFEERLSVEIKIPNELRRRRIPSLIIQPLVENSIKHAVSAARDGGSISITAAETAAGGLQIVVGDTGAAANGSSGKTLNPNGVGLRNIRERLKNYYGGTAELSVETTVGGTTATIEIPPSK